MPSALKRSPDLVAAHDVEILSVAPELRETVPASRETLTSLAIPTERTRFYSRLRTLRIAHGLTEFLRDHIHATGDGPASLVIERAEQADPTDQELLAVLLRRIDPTLLTIVVGTAGGAPEEALTVALDRYTVRHDGERAPLGQAAEPAGDDRELAVGYLATDCTGDDPAQRAAYQRLDPAERARLHDQRAEDLETRDEVSLRLGAIPFHREHGTDPSGVGVHALRFALDYCIDMGFYEATVELGTRG
ncbi:MAG TPA: hypothetical protein VFX70_10525, partial [Mycobacteriales bacterium]|nr:hypothetical protein [Mycobacteriales bacterium]